MVYMKIIRPISKTSGNHLGKYLFQFNHKDIVRATYIDDYLPLLLLTLIDYLALGDVCLSVLIKD